MGFKAGAGLTIAMTQLPSLLGVSGGGDNFFARTWLLSGQLGQIQYLVLAVGFVAIVLIVLGERLMPGKPVALGVSRWQSLLQRCWGFGNWEFQRPGKFQPACQSFRPNAEAAGYRGDRAAGRRLLATGLY